MVVGSPSHSCVLRPLRPLRSPGQSDSGPSWPLLASLPPQAAHPLSRDQDNVGWVLS